MLGTKGLSIRPIIDFIRLLCEENEIQKVNSGKMERPMLKNHIFWLPSTRYGR